MKTTLISVSLAVLTIVSGGCATTGVFQPVAPGIEERGREVLESLFADQALQTHKVRVRVARRDLVLTGYLLLDRHRGFRAIAVDEYGGKVFSFSTCGGEASVDRSPPQIDADLVKRGPVRDLELLYCATAAQPEIGRRKDGTVVARLGYRDSMLICEFDPQVERVLSCTEVSAARAGRSMVFTYEDADAVPDRVEIRNRALHYTMTADLLGSRGIADQVPCDD